MHDLIMLGIGFVVGEIVLLILLAILNANKPDEIIHKKLTSYEEGYKKGFDDGYELQKSHVK